MGRRFVGAVVGFSVGLLTLGCLFQVRPAEAQAPIAPSEIKSLDHNWEIIKNAIRDLVNSGKATEAAAEAEKFVIAARAVGEASIAYADAISTRAWIHIDHSEYDKAKPLLDRSLEIFRQKAVDQPDVNQFVARILNNLGQLSQVQDRIEEAEQHYDLALTLQEKILGPSHFDLATTLANLGYLHLLRRNFAQSENLLTRALTIRRTGEFGPAEPAAIALNLQSLATALEGQGRLAEAEMALREAVTLRRASDLPGHPQLAGALQRLAVSLQRQGKLREASQLLEEALAIRRKGRQLPLDLALNLVDLAKLRIDQRRYDDADKFLAEAIDVYRVVLPDVHTRVAEAYFHRATVAQARRDHKRARDWSRESAVRFEAEQFRNSSMARVAFQGHVQNLWSSLKSDPSARDQLIEEAFKYAQLAAASTTAKSISQMTARMASDDAELRQAIRQRQDLEFDRTAANRRLIDTLSRKDGESTAPAIRAEIISISQRVTELDQRLQRDFPDYFNLAAPAPLRVSEARNLADDEALLFVLETFDTIFVWVFSKEGVHWSQADISSEDLKRTVATLKSQLDQGPDDAQSDAKSLSPGLFSIEAAHDLYKRLFKNAELALANKTHLLVATSGSLAALPLHVLVRAKPAKSDGKTTPQQYAKADWLARSFAVSNLPSLTSLRQMKTETARAADRRKPMLAMANPIYEGSVEVASVPQGRSTTRGIRALRGGTSRPFVSGGTVDLDALRALANLDDTETEVRAVAVSLGAEEADILVRAKASEAEVRSLDKQRRLKDYRIVYFAMHGLAPQPGNGLEEPALALTVPSTASSGDDGLLSVGDIMQLDLDADWVILSACDTAAGDSFGADALSGLSRAFFYAGARSVLVTKWSIASTDAKDLMIETFASLKADPATSRAEALRRSMLKRINGPVPGRDGYWAAYPGYWAPFDLVIGAR